jgi:hypothetical protein
MGKNPMFMKKCIPLSIICFISAWIIIFLPYFKKTTFAPVTRVQAVKIEDGFSDKEEEEDGMEKAIEQEIRLTKDPRTNRVPTERLITAKKVRDQKLSRFSSSKVMASVSGINWQERGPSNIGGRTRALIFDLNDVANGYKKVWAGGVGGGLWYCNDITAASPVWNKVNDFLDNIAITAIAQNPLNPQEMYIGTGEGWYNVDAIRGLGIWKTSDGGANWTRLTSTANFSYVNKLMVDKNGAVYAAVRQYYGSDAAGIQKSTDGGATWTQVLGSGVFGSSSRGADLECAANGDVYASLGIFDNGGVYMSDYATNAANTGDAGTWVNITPNTSGVISTPTNYWNRIELACAPSNSDIVYALFQGYGSDNCTSVQQYDKSTNSWAVKAVPNTNSQGSLTNFTNNQAWYDLIAAVDPNNSNSLYVGGLDALRSDDGGSTWTQMTAWSLSDVSGFASSQNIHADHHAVVYAPGSSSRALWGTDGGIYYTADADNGLSKPSFSSKNNGYNITQYYSCALHPTSTDYFLAGAQDNGTHKFTGSGINSVVTATGGDGMFCYIDQDDPNIQITAYTNNNYYLSTDGGNTFNARFFSSSTGSFINPTDYDKAAKKLYAGNTTGTYLRWEDPATGGSTASTVSVSAFGSATISHIAVSPLTANRVYFGLNNGSVVRVDNANSGSSKTGTVIKTGTGSVSCIAIDPSNEDHIIVTYSNYGVTHVFETSNGTQASPVWTDVQNNLPDMPVRWALFDPRSSSGVLLATELGVWSTANLNGSSTDWQPTNTGLANVRVDMLKYRSGDRTIAAATHGRGLFTATIPDITTADINFMTGITSLSEQNAVTNGCRRYKDYTIPLTIANAPVGDATVTVSIQSANNAVQGVDFDFTTNGDFNSPSNVLTFADGSTTAQNITVRIYDDAEVNSDRSFTFAYSISCTTTARAGSSYQTETISIADNDSSPTLPVTATYTIGSSTYYLGNTSSGTPFDAKLQYQKAQMLYTAAELKAAGLSRGTINSIAFFITKSSTRSYQNLQVKMGMTTIAMLYDGTTLSIVPTTTVKNATTFTPASGTAWNTITLDNPFYWDGVSNLVVETCYDNGSADAANFADETIGYSDGSASNQGNMIFQDNIDCGTSYSSVTYFSGGVKPQLRFNITTTGVLAETVLNSSTTEYLTSNKDLYYYSSSGDLIAKITNLSGFDYGCTQVTIDRAGTSALSFWDNTPANYLMSKTFHVVPTTNNASGQYQITLYFTAAEKAGWEAATGNSWSDIKLIKVKSQISNYSPSTPYPDGASGVEIITPTLGTLGSNYTLTASFSTGFSGFGAGIPAFTPLPIRLLSFEGHLSNITAVLEWSTSSEQKAKNFDIEKSTDGLHYYKIGSVNAAGNSSVRRDYAFIDNKLNSINYYRLRVNDLDGRNELSHIVIIRNKDAQQNLWVVNNPFNSYIDLRFGREGSAARLQLINAMGALVAEKIIPSTSGQVRWNLPENLAKGNYIVKAIVDGKQFTSKVIKQ